MGIEGEERRNGASEEPTVATVPSSSPFSISPEQRSAREEGAVRGIALSLLPGRPLHCRCCARKRGRNPLPPASLGPHRRQRYRRRRVLFRRHLREGCVGSSFGSCMLSFMVVACNT
nr:uncharacterized protein LOC112736042 [Arachis hypogaea]